MHYLLFLLAIFFISTQVIANLYNVIAFQAKYLLS